MRTRDPEDKRRRLLDAALAEFAAYGIAGARMDRIAKQAGTSAGLIYTHFGGKGELFSAVMDAMVERAVTEVPIDATDLPEYAARMFDGFEAHPEAARLLLWSRLEGDGRAANPSALSSTKKKVAAIEAAQAAGLVSTRFAAVELLGLVLHIAAVWVAGTPEFASLSAQYSRSRQRDLVKAAVAALVHDPA